MANNFFKTLEDFRESVENGEEFNLKPEDVIQILRQLFDVGRLV